MAIEEVIPENTGMEQTLETATTIFIEDDVDFSALFEDELQDFKEHEIVTGKIVGINKDFITVDIGFKSEGRIDVHEFQNDEGQMQASEGDEIEVFLEAMEDSDGVVVLSREKAEKLRVWENIGKIYEEEGTVEGVISSRIKGGLSVDIGIKAFLPGSQVDLRPVRNLEKLLGERFEFKILKFNQKRGNIVLSRRALLEVDREERRKKTLAILDEGVVIKGFVKNITNYGAFIDLGGVDGLLHITDMTWGRIVHPSEILNIGDEIEVLVLKFDREEEKVSLGLKQKYANPWDNVVDKYPPTTRIQGRIVSLTDYGAFIELEPGVEGLIHVTEMSWTRKIRHPAKIFTIGQAVEAVVKDVDTDRKRISLSIKAAEPNPWESIHVRYPVGSIVQGKVRNITDFGIFVGLEEGIDGLVHISDLSWSQRQRKLSAFAKKGEELEVKILHIDPDKERLSLGIKQLTEDPWKDLENRVHLNDEVEGRVVNVTDFGIFVEVMDGVEGLVHVSEVDQDIPKDKLEEYYPVGSAIRAKVLKVDVDERRLGLGILGSYEDTVQDSSTVNTVLQDALTESGLVEKQVAPDSAETAEAPEETDSPADGQESVEASSEDSATGTDSAKDAPAEAEKPDAATDAPTEAEEPAEAVEASPKDSATDTDAATDGPAEAPEQAESIEAEPEASEENDSSEK